MPPEFFYKKNFHHHHKTSTTQLRNHSYTINFHRYSLHYHCRHHHRQHRHHYHYPHRQYLLHQHYRQHHHYHQHQYTNQHSNTLPHVAQHPHPVQDPHTFYLYYHTHVVLHLTLHHLSPLPARSPAVGTLEGSPTIRTTTKGGHHHLAFLKTPRTQGTHEDAHSTHKKVCFKNSNNKGNTHKNL